jgi:hypothetical protein
MAKKTQAEWRAHFAKKRADRLAKNQQITFAAKQPESIPFLNLKPATPTETEKRQPGDVIA